MPNHTSTHSPDNPWDDNTLRRRIASAGTRHPAGSPSGDELDFYAQAMQSLPRSGGAWVLGMTPELRLLATQHFNWVLTMDHNQAAIDLYTDWLPSKYRSREQILKCNWLTDVPCPMGSPTCILGDAVLPNLSPQAQLTLLERIRSRLAPGGLFITRQITIPPDASSQHDAWPDLLVQFRRGELCGSALSMGMRILGFLASCWNPDDGRLDNARVFATLDAMLTQGILHPHEHAVIQRFRFEGPNWIFRRTDWETQMHRSGWLVQQPFPKKQHWHGYYPVHVCTPNPWQCPSGFGNHA